MSDEALKTWMEKLDYFETELARTASTAQKFSLKKEIEEIKAKILGLGGDLPAPAESSVVPNADASSNTEAPTDVGVIVALREEFTELYEQLPSPQPIRDGKTGSFDYLFAQPADTGSYRCAATFVGDMGPTDAALAAERFLDRRRPRTIVMLGIAAGIDKEVKLGDVIVATSVGRYLERAKVVDGAGASFDIRPGGDAFPCSQDLVRSAQNLEFAYPQLYQAWQKAGCEDLAKTVPQWRQLSAKGWLADKPAYLAGAVASGPVVAAASVFVSWVRSTNRKYLGLEMEAGGVLVAVYGRADLTRALVLRGVSDFGDARKKGLDEIGAGGLRRVAMRNAVRLLWNLMEAGMLPRA